jgi:hypothetical protein
MPAEYKNEKGQWMQGYFCLTCGESVAMLGHTGEDKSRCKPNPELVAKLIEMNKPTAFETLVKVVNRLA